MNSNAIIEEPELRLFARLAAPQLNGIGARGSDPRASRDSPGSGLEFLDLRAYQPGDDIRHIDWRQTARRHEAVVRRFRNEAASDWFICVDCSASVGMHASKWLMSIRLASALAYTCLFSGHRVAMLLFSDRIQGMCHLGRGAHQFAALMAYAASKAAVVRLSETMAEEVRGTGIDINLIAPGALNTRMMDEVPNAQFQLIQKDLHSILLKIGSRETISSEKQQNLKNIINQGMEYNFSITIEQLNEIPRAKSGKYEEFISEVENDE